MNLRCTAMASAAKRAREEPPEGPRRAALMVCDLQERFRRAIWEFDVIAEGAKFLVDLFAELRLPVVATGAVCAAFARRRVAW